MSKHDEADLLLKLYDLRREPTMRKAREWYFRDFNPASMDDVTNTLFGENGGYVRMVWSYWDMAAALVNHGAISKELFNDTNGEHIATFLKMEPLLSEARAKIGPQLLAQVEQLIDSSEQGRERLAMMRERMKQIQATMAQRAQATTTA
jgi:hypothetical protein